MFYCLLTGVIIEWDLSTGTQSRTFPPLEESFEYTDLQFCKGMNCLLGVGSDQNIMFYDVDNCGILKTVSAIAIVDAHVLAFAFKMLHLD